jgi:hypothetical protein
MQNTELKPEPKHPFVEMIVVNSDGLPINTFCGENEPLAKILSMAAKFGSRVTVVPPLMALGQSIYSVPRETAIHYLFTFVDKNPKDVEDQVKNMPETASYYFVVSY